MFYVSTAPRRPLGQILNEYMSAGVGGSANLGRHPIRSSENRIAHGPGLGQLHAKAKVRQLHVHSRSSRMCSHMGMHMVMSVMRLCHVSAYGYIGMSCVRISVYRYVMCPHMGTLVCHASAYGYIGMSCVRISVCHVSAYRYIGMGMTFICVSTCTYALCQVNISVCVV
jgi:hypothetical protein